MGPNRPSNHECSTLGCQHFAEIHRDHCCNACRKHQGWHTENCTGSCQARRAASQDMRLGPGFIHRAVRGCFRDIQRSEIMVLDGMDDLRWYLPVNNHTLEDVGPTDSSAWQRLFQQMAATDRCLPCSQKTSTFITTSTAGITESMLKRRSSMACSA